MERWISGLGLLVMLGLGWLLSVDRRRIPWRVVSGGIGLQFAFAWFILRTTAGRTLFDWAGDLFKATIGHVDAGSSFLFAINPSSAADAASLPPRLALLRTVAFGVLPTIVFFSSFMSILYHLGVMQRVIEVLAWAMQRTLGTSGAESLSAAANIFVGQTEAPLVVRPFLHDMTYSELNAVMVGGFATIAGGVMALYTQMGIDAGHLLTASVISAPAALLMAKIMVPETETPKTLGRVRVQLERTSTNVIEAAAEGAAEGMKLAINVAAMLIAFLALLSLGNGILGWCGQQYDLLAKAAWNGESSGPWSLEGLLGYLFAPLAWVMGVPTHDCWRAGQLLGIRTVANEFLAYDDLSRWARETGGTACHPRTQLILIYALCGFANLGSIGIQIGGIGALIPQRRSDLARLGLRAMIGGMLASFMTACVAGMLLGE